MSIERELLKRFMTELKTEEDVVSLFNDIKECVAQPESFMFKDRKLTGSLIAHDDMYKKGYAQAEFDLKREPLTPQQIIEGNPSMLNVTREIFINGVQFAEKMHGIGCGE